MKVNFEYEAPMVEVIEVEVEQGFCGSGTERPGENPGEWADLY